MAARSVLWLTAILAVASVFLQASALPAWAQRSVGLQSQQVDRLLAEEPLEGQQDSLAPICDDITFLRRVSLDTIGRLPTRDEVVSFANSRVPQKRMALVARLTNDPAFGRNWGRYWRDVIYHNRTNDQVLNASGAAEQFFAEAINSNLPWDSLATEMITSQGDVRQQGATAIYLAQECKPERTAAEFSRIFLGIQMACAQCHDHPTDRWQREQLHQLAAFFPRTGLRRRSEGSEVTFVVRGIDHAPAERRANGGNRYPGHLEHRMSNLEDPTVRGTLMEPIFFLTGESIPVGTLDAQRRAAAARFFTTSTNPWFAKAAVNRIWSELVGEGFYEPVDDMGPDRQCNAPATLDYLAAQFVEHDHQMKWLFRTIMATEAYQRVSRNRRQWDEAPFLANCPQRLRAEQLIESLVTSLGVDQPPLAAGGAYGANRNAFWNRLVATYTYNPSEPRRLVQGSISQALILMNSPNLERALAANRRSDLGRLILETTDDQRLITELYLRFLARPPSHQEVATCRAYLGHVASRREAYEDLVWALLNSTEFLYRR